MIWSQVDRLPIVLSLVSMSAVYLFMKCLSKVLVYEQGAIAISPDTPPPHSGSFALHMQCT